LNILTGHIDSIKENQSLSHISIDVNGEKLSAILMFTPSENASLKIGKKVEAMFKETEVIIGKGDKMQISLRNQLKGIIQQIENGDILSKVSVQTNAGLVHSLITVNAVNQLDLTIGSEVYAMIKTNEMMVTIC
jgi:molybdopterin-binding protein